MRNFYPWETYGGRRLVYFKAFWQADARIHPSMQALIANIHIMRPDLKSLLVAQWGQILRLI